MTGSFKIKSVFDRSVVEDIARRVGAVSSDFDGPKFAAEVAAELPKFELKERSLAIARGLRQALPMSFREAVNILERSLGPDDGAGGIEGFGGFRYMPYVNFVGLFGLDDPDRSLDALGSFTRYFSAEFDIRLFLLRHGAKTMARLKVWRGASDWRLRRLVSEGTRPRLPWASRLPEFIRDPAPVLGLLEPMRHDPHEAVRRSIANNLNDISKDHPQIVLGLARRWLKEKKAGTGHRALLRHALRTLTRRSDQAALELMGIECGLKVEPGRFELSRPSYRIGEVLEFEYALKAKARGRLALTYAIHYRKANGGVTPKVFRLIERDVVASVVVSGRKSHALRQMTTRKHYPGEHRIELFANGIVLGARRFNLRS